MTRMWYQIRLTSIYAKLNLHSSTDMTDRMIDNELTH